MSAADLSNAWAGAPVAPRAWQAAALPVVVEAVRARRRPIVSAVPGAGKSHLIARFCWLALQKLRPGRRIVVVTPTRALVNQLAATIADHCGPAVGRYFSDAKEASAPIVVTCNPSLRALAEAIAPDRVALLVQDECHSSEARQIRTVVPDLAPGGMVGFTGTPFRSPPAEALSLWSDVAVRYTLAEALADKVLVPWGCVEDGRFVPFLAPRIDVTDSDEIDDVCLRLIREHGHGPGVVSAVSTADADAFAVLLSAAGIRALPIHSKTPGNPGRIEALRAGRVRCLVHVNMLSEGVDFPWLRWLCLRRPVGARVRFIQEMMRPLRAFPGKPHATLLDPHDLLGQHGIAHAAALGEALEDEAVGESSSGPGVPRPVRLPPAVALEEATRWARALLLSLQAAGAVPMKEAAGHWRTRRPTERDVKTLGKLGRVFSRYLPADYHRPVLALSREPVAASLQRGAVVDLIRVLGAVADAAPQDWRDRKPARPGGKGWTYEWPPEVSLGPLPDSVLRGLPKEAILV